MKRIIMYCFFWSIGIAYSQYPKINSLSEIHADKGKSYSKVKEDIKIQKKSSVSPASLLFKKSLVNRIIPFWEGTPWTFEGHTSKPQKGTIACGYFVSTTLKHIGLNINRYRLAQQLPINEARSLALGEQIKIISGESTLDNIKSAYEYTVDGIYFLGFDQSHVGYLLKEKDNLYVVHSNFINSEGVLIEKIEESEVFDSYMKFYLVPLSTNKALLQYWLKNKPIKIFTK